MMRGAEDYKETGVGWLNRIPKDWDMISSKRLFSERKERARPEDRQMTASQKYGVIYQDEFMKLENQKVVQVITGSDILKHVEPSDFVISMRSFQGGLEYSRDRGCISSAYVMLIPSADIVPEYFRYLFKSSAYIQALQATSNLVRDGQAMRYGNFAQVPLPVVPKNEQKEIAEFLDRETTRIDRLIERKEAFIELLSEKRKNTISSMILGLQPPFSGYERTEIKIKYVADIISKKSAYEDTNVVYIGLEHIRSWTGEIIEDIEAKPEGLVSEFKAGDVLFGKLRPNLAKVALTSFDGVCSTEALVLRPQKVVGAYLRYALSEQTFIENVVGSTYGAKMPRASWEFIGSQRLSLPSAEIQKKIADQLNIQTATFDKIARITLTSIQALQQMKSALITEAVTGQLDIQSWLMRGTGDRRLDKITEEMNKRGRIAC